MIRMAESLVQFLDKQQKSIKLETLMLQKFSHDSWHSNRTLFASGEFCSVGANPTGDWYTVVSGHYDVVRFHQSVVSEAWRCVHVI